MLSIPTLCLSLDSVFYPLCESTRHDQGSLVKNMRCVSMLGIQRGESSGLLRLEPLYTTEVKENRATVDASKVKEENLEVAGGKCWRGFWLSALNITGEIFNQFPMKVIFLTIKAEEKEYVFSKAKIEIYLRDLDLAFCRPFCYCGLHSRCHCILQQ